MCFNISYAHEQLTDANAKHIMHANISLVSSKPVNNRQTFSRHTVIREIYSLQDAFNDRFSRHSSDYDESWIHETKIKIWTFETTWAHETETQQPPSTKQHKIETLMDKG